jgi:hypothetical protein
MAIIDKPSDYFNTKLYTGTGATHNITGVGFQPDWVWIKERNSAVSHHLYDSVRGATKRLESDNTDAETTAGTFLTSFDSDGFTLGSNGGLNGSSDTYVAWNWKANGTASSNTDGSITSSVSANQDAGFSIVSYTGAGGSSNVGHGLGVAPNLIIAKNRQSSLSWFVSCDAIGWTKRLKLDGTNNAALNVAFGDTNPDSTKFYLQDNNLNTSGETHIAYCFAEKKGFSKFGSYTGNGSTDGPMVYTGFKPAWVLQKNTSITQGWQLQDNKRLGYNPDNYLLQPHTDQSESALQRVDLLSNGFKVRTTDAGQNASGNNYIYMAFAENPFVSSTGVPATAR